MGNLQTAVLRLARAGPHRAGQKEPHQISLCSGLGLGEDALQVPPSGAQGDRALVGNLTEVTPTRNRRRDRRLGRTQAPQRSKRLNIGADGLIGIGHENRGDGPNIFEGYSCWHP